MCLDIQPGDTVRIVGPSKFGFTDRTGEISHIVKLTINGYTIPAKDGTFTDLFTPDALVLVAKAKAVISQ